MKQNIASNLMINLIMAICCFGGANAWSQTYTAQRQAEASGLNLYFIGNRQSAIEPCGCRTKEQGGVEYEAVLYGVRKGEAGLRVDAGDWSSPYILANPLNSFKSRYILRAMGLMQFDVVNVGISDLELGEVWFDDMREKHPDVMTPLVSANIFKTDEADQLAFAPARIIERQLADGTVVRIGVTGVATTRSLLKNRKEELMDPNDPRGPLKTLVGDFEVRSASECLGEVVAELRPEVDLMILLNAGEFALSQDLAYLFPEFDTIVTTGRAKDPEVPMLDQEGVLLLKVKDTQGKIVGLLKLEPDEVGQWSPVGPPEDLLVSLDLPISKPVRALMEEYQHATKDSVVMPENVTKRIFAGSQRCLTCHRDVHQQWRGTPHAHAMETLVAKGEQFNPECLVCHTVGFRESNGFYTVTHSPSRLMTGVQCESCHGPAAEHANTRERERSGAKKSMSKDDYKIFKELMNRVTPPKEVPEPTCVKCHDAANDPDFDYARDLPPVKH